MIAHWQQKEHWLYRSCSSVQPYNEIWDGLRFHELRWFWNPQERWLLPVRCPLCTEIISTDTLALITAEQNAPSHIECIYCYRRFSYCPKYAYGDPRNIALIGHWDGWQPFSTSAKHSCGRYICNLMHYNLNSIYIYICIYVHVYVCVCMYI